MPTYGTSAATTGTYWITTGTFTTASSSSSSSYYDDTSGTWGPTFYSNRYYDKEPKPKKSEQKKLFEALER